MERIPEGFRKVLGDPGKAKAEAFATKIMRRRPCGRMQRGVRVN